VPAAQALHHFFTILRASSLLHETSYLHFRAFVDPNEPARSILERCGLKLPDDPNIRLVCAT
jgi:hypothetical protein